MNSGKAKKIAKSVYGNMSRKGTKYERDVSTGQIFTAGLRRVYKTVKAAEKK